MSQKERLGYNAEVDRIIILTTFSEKAYEYLTQMTAKHDFVYILIDDLVAFHSRLR
jgi:hypothetical protein